MKLTIKRLEKQDLTGKTIIFDLIAGPRGEGEVYQDNGHSCLVNITNGGNHLGSKTIVFKSEITDLIEPLIKTEI